MQNRQREDFAALLSDIYPDLETNHDRVKDNDPPEYLEKSVFFWHHDSEETKERSVTNEEEAIRAVNLALFLVQQGYTPNKITILATYRGQRNLIRRKMEEGVRRYAQYLPKQARLFLQPKTEDNSVVDDRGKKKMIAEDTVVKINTVDMYQGDENDVVIVSLVRSNKNGDIGFLKEMNRRCVAQSRAKCGLYFIGDVKMFRSHKTWKPLIAKLKDMNSVGEEIGLICKDHPEAPHNVKDGEGMCLQRLVNFCEQPCGKDMDCGEHLCTEKCQVVHLHSECKARVAFTHELCEHGDIKFCHENPLHKKCLISIKFSFEKCGHQSTRECWEPEELKTCLVKQVTELPCGHPVSKECSKDIQEIECRKECNQKRDGCGHICHGDHKCFKHAVNECKDCKELERELRKQRRAEEKKQRENNEARVKEQIEMLKKDTEALGKVWYKEILKEGGTIATHLDIEDKIKRYVRAASPYYPVITKIEEVVNPKLEIRFRKRSLKLLKSQISPILNFYSTSGDGEGIKKITENGFALPKDGKICLTSHSTTIAKQTDSEEDSKKLLLCEVFLGKTKDMKVLTENAKNNKDDDKKYDSIVVPRNNEEGKSYDQFVVFKDDQLFPRYVVSYRLEVLEILLDVTFEGRFESCKKVIKPQRQVNNNDPLQTHFSFVESRFLRMMNRRKSGVSREIAEIEFYINPDLERSFQIKLSEFKAKYPGKAEADPIYGFHGTKTDRVVETIMNENFNLSKQGKFGAGVYFSEQPHYTFGYGGENHLILAKILPGKIYECTYSGMGSAKCEPGYDSHGGIKQKAEGTFDEIVIFDTDQILPMYVIHFK